MGSWPSFALCTLILFSCFSPSSVCTSLTLAYYTCPSSFLYTWPCLLCVQLPQVFFLYTRPLLCLYICSTMFFIFVIAFSTVPFSYFNLVLHLHTNPFIFSLYVHLTFLLLSFRHFFLYICLSPSFCTLPLPFPYLHKSYLLMNSAFLHPFSLANKLFVFLFPSVHLLLLPLLYFCLSRSFCASAPSLSPIQSPSFYLT